jgi:hypothetical protein
MGHPLLGARRRRRRWLVFVALWLSCGLAEAGDIYVVTNGSDLSATDVREIYLGEKEFSGPLRLVPVDNQAAQAAFLAKVLSMNEQRYTSLWVRKSFREGLNPPLVMSSDREVMSFVRQTPGAVGYVSALPHDKEIHVVGKF